MSGTHKPARLCFGKGADGRRNGSAERRKEKAQSGEEDQKRILSMTRTPHLSVSGRER